MALPVGLDAQGGLRLPGESASQWAQFGRAAQRAIGEKAMHDRAEPECGVDVVVDEFIGNAAAEPAVTAVLVKPQQVIAVVGGFANPQFADHAAVGERFLHSKGS